MDDNQFKNWKRKNRRAWNLVNSKGFRESLPSKNVLAEAVRKAAAQSNLGDGFLKNKHIPNFYTKSQNGMLNGITHSYRNTKRLRGINNFPQFYRSDYSKRLHEMAERARKSVEKFRSKYPEQKKVIDEIYQSGWAVGNEIGNFSNLLSHPEKFTILSKEDFDNQYTDFYVTKKEMYSELKSIRSSLTLHHEVVDGLISTLQESPNSWKLLYPQIFSIMDAILVSQRHDGSLEVDDYSNSRHVREMRKKSKKNKEFEVDIFKYIYFKTLKKVEKLWESHPFELPSENVKFGRNSVQHGRYDPNNYEYKQFVQLVILMTTLCIYSEGYGRIERD